MKYETYPKMKDSGFEWIGEIPKDWHIDKIKYHYEIVSGKVLQSKQKSSEEKLVDYLTVGNVLWEKINLKKSNQMWANEHEIKKIGIKNNDLLICEGGEAGRSAIISGIKNKCIVQNHIHRIRPKDELSNQFLMYMIEFFNSIKFLETIIGRVTIASLPRLTLANLPMIVPEYEQEKIAEFLQMEIKKIDESIMKNKELGKILNEKKHTTINNAVTKGLDHSRVMKDSGVEWIKKIPKGWDISSLGKHCNEIQDMDHQMPKKTDSGIPFLSISHVVGSDEINFNEAEYISERDYQKFLKKIKPEKNDILYSRVGTICEARLIREDRKFAFTYNVVIIKPKKILNSSFLFHLLNSEIIKERVKFLAPKTTHPFLGLEDIKRIQIIIPDIKEQKKIAEFLDEKIPQINSIIYKNELRVKKLNEYRQSLIANTISGKICITN